MTKRARPFGFTCALLAFAPTDAAADDREVASKTPATAFASGRLFLSVDDAFPLLSLGSAAPRSDDTALKLGDPAGPGGSAHPIQPALDVGLERGITPGFSVLTEHEIAPAANAAHDAVRERTHYTTLAARIGWLRPIGRSLAVWPRFGFAWKHFPERIDFDDAPDRRAGFRSRGFRDRADLRFDANLAIIPKGAWAIIVGPSLSGFPGSSLAPQLAFTGGLVGRLDSPVRPTPGDGNDEQLAGADEGDEGEAPRRLPRVVLGVDRVAPLLRYDAVERDEPSTEGLPPRAAVRTLSAGMVDSKRSSPTAFTRAALDVRVYEGLTFGAAFAIGWLRSSGRGTSLLPESPASTAFATSLAPRVGWLARISRVVLVWPRAGVSHYYAHVDVDRPDRPERATLTTHHLAIDVGAPFVFEVAEGYGLTISPDVSIPVSGANATVFTASLSGGVVVMF